MRGVYQYLVEGACNQEWFYYKIISVMSYYSGDTQNSCRIVAVYELQYGHGISNGVQNCLL
jgi:hypothetical protein